MREHKEQLTTADGFELAVTYYRSGVSLNGAAIIVPAMSVPQKFYRDFAIWLSEQGLLVVTFDYRGIGASAPSSLKHYRADIRDWAEQDCAAILDYTHALICDRPLYWIGHSLGGQIIGLVPNCHLISKAINIASGNGYWRGTANMQKLASLYLWYLVVPVVSMFCSYFPGKKMRKVGDLPLGVIHQWRRWCLSKRYLLDNVEDAVRQRYDSVKFPMTFYALADDEMLSVEAIESAYNFYPFAPRELTVLDPHDNNLTAIGHFGFFKQARGEQLWPKYIGSLIAA